MLQSKIKQFYYPKSQDLICNQRIGVLKIHSKSLAYITGKLTDAWRTPISYESSVGSRDRFTPLPISMMKRFLSLAAGFAFTSREYILQHLPMTASET